MTLRIVGQTLIRTRDNSFRWIDVKLFEFDAGLSTLELCSALISHGQFRDGYIGAGPDLNCIVHGRWFIEGLSAQSYASIGRDAAHRYVDVFRDLGDDGFSSAVAADVDAVVRRRIDEADERLHLDAAGAVQHEVSWVLTEFEEVVLIRRTPPELALIVMGID